MKIYSMASSPSFGQKPPKNVPGQISKEMEHLRGELEKAMRESAAVGEPRTPQQRAQINTLTQVIRVLGEKIDSKGAEFDASFQEPSNLRAIRTIGIA